MNASVFAGVNPDVRSETVHGIYPALIASRPGAVRIFHTAAEFFDIGSPRDYLDTAITLASREQRGRSIAAATAWWRRMRRSSTRSSGIASASAPAPS